MGRRMLSNAQVRQHTADDWNAVANAWETRHAEFQANSVRVAAMQAALNEAHRTSARATATDLFLTAEKLLEEAFPGAL